ncbi:hypothetical protein M2650_13315 [Luteimonas sp. SX5]|uniref:DUF4239 domain-containing protein n=1 Tax=Luteimonas galliterrae TaxID=2940486 RepID=A0ABT0ML53_9GAMM|nr:hypothetical protein [Luteimonas galliterrae]MCL1635601.1 hypothetical protein [Luteimonas galliterrae]
MPTDPIPIPVVFVATIIVVAAAVEIGYLLGKAVRRRSADEKESPVSVISGSILGLAAFMLAFTFGIVSARHDAKKGLVREDANAIRVAWQRSDFLPEADRVQAKGLLARYLDTRLRFTEARKLDSDHVRAALAETRQLHDRLWSMAVANARRDMDSDVAALYIEALNEMAAVNAMRVAIGIQARIAKEIWIALFFLIGLGMLVVGYQTAIAESKRSMIQPVLVISFAMVITLIATLDRPDSGVLKVTQQPLVDLRNTMSEATQPTTR